MGKTWKHAERRVAEILDGRRVGCTGKATADVLADGLAVEVKHRGKLPQWLHSAIEQAEANAGDRLPVVILHEKRQQYTDALTVIRLERLQELLERANGE